jgi:hypothetical protein
MARFGYLLLCKGKWGDSQVLDPGYIELATMKWIDSKAPTPAWTESTFGYGFHFWMNSFGGFRASGMLMQELVVLPEHDLVVVMLGSETSGAFENLDVFPRFIIPACETGYKGGKDELKEKLELFEKSLSRKSQMGTRRDCSGKVYKLEKPIIRSRIFNICTHLTAIGFDNRQGKMDVTLVGENVRHTLRCGTDGTYIVNDMEYPIGGSRLNVHPALRGEWLSEDTFYFEIRPLSISMWVVYWIHFIGPDEILLETYEDARFSVDGDGDDKRLGIRGFADRESQVESRKRNNE